MKLVSISAVLLLLCSATYALDCGQSQCASTQDGYFIAAVTQDSPTTGERQSAKILPHWTISATADTFSDQLFVSVSTPASKPVKCRWGTKIPSLVMECSGGQTIVRFETHCRISTSTYDDYGDVTYRIDKNDAETLRFSESDDNRSMGLWDPDSSVPFIQSLLDSERLAAKIKPYSDEPFVAFFNTSGLANAIAPIQNACDWENTADQ
ncbi:MAG: type VI secretion protein [Cognatishimia sp.]|nr:type VI secretion protein [Cognatishimia sp.]